jgi:hypothetical protein
LKFDKDKSSIVLNDIPEYALYGVELRDKTIPDKQLDYDWQLTGKERENIKIHTRGNNVTEEMHKRFFQRDLSKKNSFQIIDKLV